MTNNEGQAKSQQKGGNKGGGGGGGGGKVETAIKPTRADDYAEWYQQVVRAADLAENSPVRGCMVIKPWGYAIWENIQRELDARFKATGNEDDRRALLAARDTDAKTAAAAAEAARDAESARWQLLPGTGGLAADPSWAVTLDTLRRPRKKDEKLWSWRRDAPIRPVVFTDPGSLDGEVVHLHLEHRVVQRLLSRFLSQGFVHDELSRACVVRTRQALRHVVALGRLSLYGDNATRLHDEVLAVAMRFTMIDREGASPEWVLEPTTEADTQGLLRDLEDALKTPHLRQVPDAVRAQFLGRTAEDVDTLRVALEATAGERARAAEKRLKSRGTEESRSMREILVRQKKRIEELLAAPDLLQQTLPGVEQAQREAERRYWPRRLEKLTEELDTEPARIRKTYEVRATRVEPVGLVYLVPLSA